MLTSRNGSPLLAKQLQQPLSFQDQGHPSEDEEALMEYDNDDDDEIRPSSSSSSRNNNNNNRGVISDMVTTALSQRIRSVRPEVVNGLSFFSVLSSLYEDHGLMSSIGESLFLLCGVLILCLDVYFMYCQWQLNTHHAIPIPENYRKQFGQLFQCKKGFGTTINSHRSVVGRRTRSVAELDDLLSDLPQTIWVLLYLWNFKFSVVAMVCGLHSTFCVAEGLFKLQEAKTAVLAG